MLFRTNEKKNKLFDSLTRKEYTAKRKVMKKSKKDMKARVSSDPVLSNWKNWINYRAIVQQVPFFLFLAVLAVIYIYNGHYADKTIRKISRLSKEVKELQYEYKTVKSDVMFQSKQSELARAVEPLGLKELTEAPVILDAGH